MIGSARNKINRSSCGKVLHEHTPIGNIRFAFFLNLSFTIIEIAGGILTNSLAILSDALHDFGDSISLGLSWILERYSRRDKDEKYSYGYRRYSLLSALINSFVLIGGSVYILVEVVPRIISPRQVYGTGMLYFAILGVVINGFAFLRLRKGRSLNERVLSLHLFEDVLGWFSVMVVSIILIFKELYILDSILCLLITAYILYNAFKNLRSVFLIFLQAVPEGISIKEIDDKLLSLDKVKGVHHTHVWSMDSLNNVLSTHIVVEDGTTIDEVVEIKKKVKELFAPFGIEHITVEVEVESEFCKLRGKSCF